MNLNMAGGAQGMMKEGSTLADGVDEAVLKNIGVRTRRLLMIIVRVDASRVDGVDASRESGGTVAACRSRIVPRRPPNSSQRSSSPRSAPTA